MNAAHRTREPANRPSALGDGPSPFESGDVQRQPASATALAPASLEGT
jgi:hypothetical protein